MPGVVVSAASTALIQAQHHFLSATDLDRLMLVIDSSLKVRLRHHFFSWTQGAVQSLLPHDALLCVLNNTRTNEPQVDFFASMVIPDADREFLQRANGGIYADLARNWRRNERRPFSYSRPHGNEILTGDAQSVLDLPACARLSRLPFSRVATHALVGLNGEITGLFGLFGADGNAGPRELYLLELLLPHLFAVWLRVQTEQPLEAPGTDLPIELKTLTGRQIEILRWVHEGKSNIEIGLILDISALTVKNHVQKILRKLNVQNRTQAVAKCLSHRILKSHKHS